MKTKTLRFPAMASSGIALLALCNLQLQAQVFSGFDAGSEGWAIAGYPDFTPSNTPQNVASVTWTSEGGNPGGFIRSADQGTVTWFTAPAAYQGDKSSYLGGSLTYDLRAPKLTGVDYNPAEEGDVAIIGPSLVLVAKSGAFTGPDWTTLQVSLSTATAWHIGTTTGPLATQLEIASVLSDISILAIRGEYISGPDDGQLDNVTLALAPVPEPAEYGAIMGLALVACGVWRRARR